MKEHTNRCVLIMPYFGRLPSCLGTYLASLRGKNFDVLWISDLPVREHPDNFKIVHMTFDECKARIEDRLGVHVCVNGGRRLCDFKPMYGQIFEDLIREYGYWGFGDCDLVYGEALNDFLQKTIETGLYDVVSMQAEYLSGPTCFLRNNERMRMLYRKARDWERVCAWNGSRILNFDECGGMFFSQLKAGTMTMEDCSRIHDSFAAVIWREPNLNFYHENVIDECNLRNGEVIEMQGGGLSRDGIPLVAYHFVLAKESRWFFVSRIPYGHVRDYRIVASGFYHGEWAWRTRFVRGIFRRLFAIVEAVRANGFSHLVNRFRKDRA